MAQEKKGLVEENEFMKARLNSASDTYEAMEGNAQRVSDGLGSSLDRIAQLENGQKATVERAEVKLRLLEETLTRRSDK